MLKRIIMTGITALILISCATSPTGRKQLTLMPPAQMDAMGAEAFNNLKKKTPIETDNNTNRYVICIAKAIVEVSNSSVKEWEVQVFRDDTANAFALPGGKVGVHTGLLKVAENPHQLSAVIGHEIAHVLANHSNERVSQQSFLKQGLAIIQVLSNPSSQKGQMLMGLLGVGAQMGILLPYSRIQESEADEMGLYFMAKAGFDPRESVKLWQNMGKGSGGQPPEFLSTHPSHNTRITRLNQNMGRAMQNYEEAKASGKNPNCRL